jgi:hypothetical protein
LNCRVRGSLTSSEHISGAQNLANQPTIKHLES